MPTALNLQRSSEVFFSTVDLLSGDPVTNMKPVNTWKLEVLSGFSVTADSAIQDITPMESGNNQDRGTQRFNTAVNPVNWSVKTYLKPTKARAGTTAAGMMQDANIRAAADWFMWQSLLSNTTIVTASNIASGSSVWRHNSFLYMEDRNQQGNAMASTSQIAQLTPYQLYFKLDNVVYQVQNAITNKVTIDAGIDEIITDTWDGYGSLMTELTGLPRTNAISVFGGIINSSTTVAANANASELTQSIAYHPYTGMNVAGTFQTHPALPNRLSYIEVNWANAVGGTNYAYTFPVTSLSFSIDNGAKYITPEELGTLNAPIGNITGARTVSGSFTTYLRNASATNVFNQILTDTRTNSASSANINLVLSGSAPNVQVLIGAAQFSFPQLAIEDITSMSVDFLAQKSVPSGGEAIIRTFIT